MTDLSITAANVIKGDNATIKHGTAGETIVAGKAVYEDPTTKKMMLADSDSATAAAHDAVGIALNSMSLNQPITYQTAGDIAIGGTMTAGATYFVSSAAGGICPDADVGASEEVVQLGIAKSATVLGMAIQYPGVTR